MSEDFSCGCAQSLGSVCLETFFVALARRCCLDWIIYEQGVPSKDGLGTWHCKAAALFARSPARFPGERRRPTNI